nr:uncharacterized protein LOC109779926 [Aegilops tauschii subsp. strangulata]
MYIRMQTGIHGVSYTKSYFNTAADRLSALPNDVLARILSFAPTHEAAATALLSRRWRSVWHRTSFLNLDTRPYCTRRLEPFFEDAHDILASLRRPRRGSRRRRHGAGLKTLKLFLEEGAYYISKSWRREGDDAEPDHRVAELLADPAVARLEELSIGCAKGHTSDDRYFPPLASLPCAVTLRVLELTNCNLEPPSTAPSSGLAFPCLTDLTLRNCFFLEGYLQDVVDATPALTSLALANVRQKAAGSGERLYDWDYFMLPLRLRCPTVTALVLVTFVDEKQFKASAAGCSGIELDMPSLRFFRFQGYPVKLSLTSPAPGLATRALKVRLQSIEDIVADDEDKDGGVILPTFPNLKLLELDGEYWLHKNSKTVVATARLLRSCPVPAQTSLRKVTLRFKFLRKVNCFPTQLAKFLAENALVLEEMHVDDGSQFWPDHLCHKVGMWRAESFRRKNLPATAAGFRVCQLPMDKPAKDPDEESCYGYGYEYD